MISIRHAAPADAVQWSALRVALWPEEDARNLASEAEEFFRQPPAGLEGVLVAADTDHPEIGIVGFAELSLRVYAEGCASSPVGFLEGWYVAPEYRRRGIGGALVAASENWARDKGCVEFASDTEIDNTLSAEAHFALGFEEAALLRCFRKDLT